MTKIVHKTGGIVVLSFIAVVAIATATATRFAVYAAPGSDPSQPNSTPPGAQPLPEILKARAVETKNLSFGYRHRRMFRSDSWEDAYVGGLVENHYWEKDLPIAAAQANAVKKLDALIQEANDQATLVAADYMDTNPPDYQQYNARLNRRLHETLRHAERMTSLGLLTESQAAMLLQLRISGSGSPLYVLYDKNVQELLGMTAKQIKELEQVGDNANRREARLNLWTVNPKEQELVRTQMAANMKQMNEETLNVLTPNQRELWSLLSAPRSLPAKAPDVPAPSESEAARIKLKDASPVFRVLTETPGTFKLSDLQKKFLNRLEVITRDGLYWIRLRNSKDAAPNPLDRIAQEFVKHAEQVALFGILTEKQAEQVESATK